jgi:hypothetical protein
MDQTITKERLLTPNPQNTTVRESELILVSLFYILLSGFQYYIISVDLQEAIGYLLVFM